MWLFRGNDDDSDFESDYDSDEYETDDSEEELDSNDDDDDALVTATNDTAKHNHKEEDVPPERAETEEDFSEEDEEEVAVEENGEEENGGNEIDQEEELVDESKDDESVEKESELEDSREEEESGDEEEEDSSDEEEEETTSIAEKRALLALAAENDRVDILKAVLNEQDRNVLLHSTDGEIPPLHVAVSYGSTHATSCLLRMGANPAIRPNTNDKRYAHASAWELAFGTTETSNNTTITIKPVDMAPSKREGIRHAFTAEALRCIGSDEVERLVHLLESGMPPSIDIGGKNLYGWSCELQATKCQELTKPMEEDGEEQEEEKPTASAVVSHLYDSDSLLSLDNRLEELESLSKALSSCLDNLAEEVSVCHGLLLLGGGASALASHVKSLKVLQERREVELEKCVHEWNDAQDELAYWLQQNGGADGFDDTAAESTSNGLERKRSFLPPGSEEEEETQRRLFKAQIAASENKVRKLRASIADLSEENARDLVEVERRGLSGGIKLVRTLREELREVEFQLSEAKSETAACRARVNLIVSRLESDKKKGKHHDDETPRSLQSIPNGSTTSTTTNGTGRVSSLFVDEDDDEEDARPLLESDKIASGDSDAIALRAPGNRGYLPIDLWDIILRIIGFGRVAVKKSVRDNTPSAMII